MNKQVSASFVLDLENILNSLVENKNYIAQVGKITIRYIGETENKRQVFEIERKVK